MNWKPFNLIPTLLRPARAVIHAPPVIQTPSGPAGSEVHLGKPAGFGQVTSKMDRPATYSRRNGAQRSLRHPTLGIRTRWDADDQGHVVACHEHRQWQWGKDGRLKMRAEEVWGYDARLIPVIPPHVVLPAAEQRTAWNAFAPIRAGRSPFKNLFARNA